ncbi:hypothetical protein J6590_019281 [Homalodisca vitripennis]|nr:hypothetical protein J6590_019281 [Homalodisca vitripennis]
MRGGRSKLCDRLVRKFRERQKESSFPHFGIYYRRKNLWKSLRKERSPGGDKMTKAVVTAAVTIVVAVTATLAQDT